MKLRFTEMFSKRVRKIHTGSELLLAYELDKYAKLMLGKPVVVDVPIAKELIGGEHFTFVVQNGLEISTDYDSSNLVDISKNLRFFFKGTVEGVRFEKETDEEVVYNFNFDQQANFVLHYDNRSAGYVSLIAFLIIRAKAEGKPVPTLRIAHSDYNHGELEYVDLFILKDYGNRLLEDLVKIEYLPNRGSQPEWEAFVVYNRQRGYMDKPYTIHEKYKYLRKNFEVGDVVLLYKRSKSSQGRTINTLKSCYPAVISYFDDTTIKLTYYPIIQTRFTRAMELSSVDQDLEDEGRKPIYTDDDYERFDTPTVTFNLSEVGVDTHTWVEQDFFIKPVDFDGTYQYLRTPEGLTHVFLSTLDVIYAVFEDRKVQYNKTKFLNTYFKNRQPVYEYYKEQLEKAGIDTSYF